MRRKLLVLSALSGIQLLLAAAWGCNKPVDSCGGVEPKQLTYCYNLKGISVELLGSSGILDSNDYVSGKTLAIKVQMQSEATTCFARPSVNPFISSANACTPPPPLVSYKGAIKEIIITSNADYDATHPAGTNLNEYFKSSAGDNDVNSYRFESNVSQPSVEYYMDKSPANTGKHIFTITYRMVNGTEFTATSVPVLINKA